MATYNSTGGGGDFNQDSTWAETGHPSTGDTAIITSGDTVTLTADDAIGSIDIQGTLTTDGTARTLTLDANADSYICQHRGTVSTTINLVINSDFAGDKLIRLNNGGNGNFNDVSITLQSTSRKLTIGTEAASIDGDLTITQGEFDTDSSNDYALTVTKACTVGTAGTLNLNGSTVSLGTINVGNGASASMTFSSATTTITLDPNSTHPTWGFSLGSAATVNFNGGTIKFAKVDSGTRYLQMGGQGVHVLNDVIIDTNHNIPWAGFFEAASLDIQDGELNSYGGSDGITITGDLTVGNGTDAAALTYTSDSNGFHDQTFGSVRVKSNGTFEASNQTTTVSKEADTGGTDFMFHNDGTFTHNDGKFVFDDAGLSSSSNVRCSSSFYDVELTMGSFSLTSHHNMNVARDFTVTTGTYNDGSNGFTITGDVSVANGATLNLSNSSTQTKTLGSISVASGGTFRACRGTTTITKANGGTDGRAFYIHSSATFTHNNGLVKFTASSPQVAPTSSGQTSTSHPFYDLEQTTGTMQWKAEHHKVLNNCTMKGSAFNGSTGNVHVLGICRLTGETFNSGDTATNDNNFFQTLVIESGATVDLSAINITVGSLRNLGGTIQ